jgi:zinc transport system substrate-binding protein
MISLVLASCVSRGTDEAGIRVVASAYPAAFIAQGVSGPQAQVVNLTPPGVEPHDLELDPFAIEDISTADVVVYLGQGFQPAVEAAVTQDASGAAVDVLPTGALLEGDVVDPHFWLSPARMLEAADEVEAALVRANPANAGVYRQNAEDLRGDLRELDTDFREGLADCERRTIVTAHAAFGYLANDYDLEQQAIAGISPESEPDPERITELAQLVRDEGVTTVFTEMLVSPKVAETLASEAGVSVEVLNPLEGLTQEQIDSDQDYLSLMRENLAALREALGCR